MDAQDKGIGLTHTKCKRSWNSGSRMTEDIAMNLSYTSDGYNF